MANPWYLVVETPAGPETWDGPVEMLIDALAANPGAVLYLPGAVEVRFAYYDSDNGLDVFKVAGDPDPYDATLVLDKARELGAW